MESQLETLCGREGKRQLPLLYEKEKEPGWVRGFLSLPEESRGNTVGSAGYDGAGRAMSGLPIVPPVSPTSLRWQREDLKVLIR